MPTSLSPRLALLVAAALLALAPAPASAEWKKWFGGGPSYLFDVSAPDSANVFTGGMELVTSGMIPLPKPRLFASADGGHLFRDIAGSLANLPYGTITSVDFLDDQRGFVAIGKKVYVTADRGQTWAEKNVGFEVAAIEFFSALAGVAVGEKGKIARTEDGGATWIPAASPTASPLGSMFWADELHGWACGNDAEETTDPYTNETTTTLRDGVVVFTSDGGKTWKKGFEVQQRGLDRLFFLKDGLTGWMAAYEIVDSEHTLAHLYKTTDGGKTFSDLNVPARVGTLKMLMDAPINTSYFAAMHWVDAQRGHLGGTAFLMKGADDKRIYRTVDFVTSDGGATWTKTDLGTITVNMQGGSTPPSDGQVLGGTFRALRSGWLVGESTTVWGYEANCAKDEDCGPGSRCDALHNCQEIPPGTCYPPCSGGAVCVAGACRMPGECSPACAADETCVDGECLKSPPCDPECTGGWECVGGRCIPPAPEDGSQEPGDGSGAAPGGCSCAAGPGTAALGALWLLLGALARRRSRRA